MKLLFLDTETTGLDPEVHAMIQVAGIIEIDGETKEIFEIKLRPWSGAMVSGQAMETTGLKLSDIEAYPDSFEGYQSILSIFDRHINKYDKQDKFYMVGQNPSFDYSFLKAFFVRHGNTFLHSYIRYHMIDTVGLTAAFKLAGRIDVSNMKLATVAEAMNIDHSAHNALGDITATKQIFERYVSWIKLGNVAE